jgi:O-antigen/teichoic acid export membrane protein
MKLIGKVLQSNTFFSLLGNGLSAIMGLLLFRLLATNFTQEDLGRWQVFIVGFALMDVIRSGLLQNGLITRYAKAKSDDERQILQGTAWYMALISSAILIILCWIAGGIFYVIKYQQESINMVLIFLPLTTLFSLPGTMGTFVLNALGKIKMMVWVRIAIQTIFLSGVYFSNNYSLNNVGFWFVSGYLASGLVSIIMGWTNPMLVRHKNKATLKDLTNFGKYSMGTSVGSIMLRSSDVFLLGSFLGPASVAIYAVAQKLVEIVEMPMRSFTQAVVPKLAHLYQNNDKEKFKIEFEKNAGLLFWMVLPLCLLCFIFPYQLVELLGGSKYHESAEVLRLFSVYMALMPLDRYTGIGMDLMNIPEANFKKVNLQLLVNVIGDIIVILLFASVWWVGFISIFTYGSGILLGMRILKKEGNIHILHSLSSGMRFIFETLKLTKH